MTNLAKRTITGVLGAALMIFLILWNQYSFAGLFLFISIMSLWEFYSLATNEEIKPQKWMGLIAGIIIYMLVFALSFNTDDISLLALSTAPWLMIPFLFAIFIIELYRKQAHPFTNIAFTLLGVFYLPFTLALLSLIAIMGIESTFHPQIVLGCLFILWASDIGAYFAGKKFGKRKLFERISPKKTWEGSLGGAVFAFLVAHFVSIYIPFLTRIDWAVITAIIIVFGTLGDLIESMFKRSIQIKDSGSILPGHGGFLDRFDGLFISSPFVFSYLFIVYS